MVRSRANRNTSMHMAPGQGRRRYRYACTSGCSSKNTSHRCMHASSCMTWADGISAYGNCKSAKKYVACQHNHWLIISNLELLLLFSSLGYPDVHVFNNMASKLPPPPTTPPQTQLTSKARGKNTLSIPCMERRTKEIRLAVLPISLKTF